MGYAGREFDFSHSAGIAREIVRRLIDEPLPRRRRSSTSTAPPATRRDRGDAAGQAPLRRRAEAGGGGRGGPAQRYKIYGFEPSFEDEPGTDLAAVARGRVAITPIHFDLTDHGELERLAGWDLDAIGAAVGPAAGG